MVKFSKFELTRLIEDDIYFEDLTTHTQHIKCDAKLEIFSREDLYVSCIDIVQDIAAMMQVKIVSCAKNGDFIKTQKSIVELKSSYENIHKIWKIAQILLEWSCKISTYTRLMLNEAQSVNKNCQILTTRKTFPFAKKFCLKAVMEGGGKIHRQSLDDSVLFFDNHIKPYTSFEEFCTHIPIFKSTMPEKKIMVECDCFDKAILLFESGVDSVQCDKMQTYDIKNIVEIKNQRYSNAIVTASGGINLKNIKIFASTGINGAITSAPYAQGMADLGAKLTIL